MIRIARTTLETAQEALELAERRLDLAKNPPLKKKGWRESGWIRCLFRGAFGGELPHAGPPTDVGESNATATQDGGDADMVLAMMARQQMRTEEADIPMSQLFGARDDCTPPLSPTDEEVSNPVAFTSSGAERDDEKDGDVEEV